MKKITRPAQNEYAMYYDTFMEKAPKDIILLDALKNQMKEIIDLYNSLEESQLLSSYQEGKWSMKDILVHLLDCERVFVYRAMRFAREDRSSQPYFDENEFAQSAQADKINTRKLLKEYKQQRLATMAFFDNLKAEQLKRKGIASQYNMSVRACAWIIYAHELHHLNVIKGRYL